MTLPTNDPKTGKQWRLILLAAVVSLSMGGVFAYRFAVRSIEEKIVELQERKLQLSDRILGGESLQAQGLTREELLELLR